MNRHLHLNTSIRNVSNEMLASGLRVNAALVRSLFSKVNFWFTPPFTNLDQKLVLAHCVFTVLGVLPGSDSHKHVSLHRFQRNLLVPRAVWLLQTGSIPVWMPIAVMARGFLTDGLQRSFGYPKFGWAHALTSSRISRVLYGITKMLAFTSLAAASSFEHFLLEQGSTILATIAVVYCLVRGLPFFFLIRKTP